MTHTLVGFFEDHARALQAQSEIIGIKIPESDVQVFDRSAPTQSDENRAGWWESLKEAFGWGPDESNTYQEGLRRGGTLLTVRTEESNIDRVADILNRSGAIDIDEKIESAGQSAAGSESASAPISSPQTPQGGTIPVVEEELKVGKRAVRRGGVRIYRQVVEQPVEETVQLRNEHVRVVRQPVDRPVTVPAGLFENQTIEMAEIDEEPVVSKEARVVEEVTLQKDVRERAETVRDTVRRSDVQVEELSGDRASSEAAWNDEDARSHWSSHYGSSGVGYDSYDPAYRFGSQLAGGQNNDSSDWSQLEPEARRWWEAEHQGTWDQFKDAVRHSWERAKQKLPAGERRAA